MSLPAEKSDLAVKASSTENATEECKGDMDGNGRVDFLDIVPFRDALGLVNGTGQYTWIADCNHDFNATTEDINCFVDNLLGKPVTECRLIQRTIAIPDCKGDINGDGIVSFLDITPFTTFVYSEDYSWNADYDNNDDVDMADLNAFANALMHPETKPECR
ncbi:MAG: hypothetical protein KJ858_04230 [Nanoarchaeota archaeon]|nr:hypothetical protein [Nanoarchaeota archaeon]